MDADRFDSIARTLSAPSSRRAALGATLAGGLIGALGLGRPAPEVRAAQGGACVMQFAAQVRQGPSFGRAFVPNAERAGELRGELSFSLEQSGRLQNGLLLTPGGESFPVVGQAMGHSLQLRIELGEQGALVAVGVGEQQISRCQGPIDGMASGPDIGDLGDWHATAVQQAGGRGQGANNETPRGNTAGAASGATGAGTERAGRGGRARDTGRGTAGSGSAGGGAVGTGAGSTEPSCPSGETYCSYVEECRDLRTSPVDCGACGTRCPSLACQEGVLVRYVRYSCGEPSVARCSAGVR